jgi:hypothetical protein
VEPGSESAGEEPVGDEEQPKPQFDLNLAVVLAGFAFEAYSSPPVSPLLLSYSPALNYSDPVSLSIDALVPLLLISSNCPNPMFLLVLFSFRAPKFYSHDN